jgi:hypothetical protein
MLNRYTLIAIAALAAVAAWLLLPRGEEAVILDRLEEARELAEVREAESGVTQLARARDLGELFSHVTRFDLTNLGLGITQIGDRNELVRRIAGARARLVSLEVDLRDADVTISDGRARVDITGKGVWTVRGEEGRFLDIHRVEVNLENTGGEWRISGGRHLEDLRPPPE